LPPIFLAYVEAGDRPDWQIIDSLPGTIKPRQQSTRRKLTPADRKLAVERNQAWRRNNLVQVRPVRLLRPAPVFIANAPVHAPATAARAFFAKQVPKGEPEIGSTRMDRELLHVRDMGQPCLNLS